LSVLASVASLGLSNRATAQEKPKQDALLFLIAGDRNAEEQAPFSRQSNTAAGVLGVAGLTSRRAPRPADDAKRCNKPVLVFHYGTIVR